MKIARGIFLVALLAVPVLAADEPKPIVETTGSLDRVLDDKGMIDLYVKLADANATAPLITEITRDGVGVSVTLFQAKFGTTGPQNILHLSAVDPAKLDAGTFAIGIEIGVPPPADQGKPPLYKASSFIVKLKHNVAAQEKATLTFGPLSAERVTYLPGWTSWAPNSWTVQETGGKGAVSFERPQWSVSVKTSGVNPEVRTIRVSLSPPETKTLPDVTTTAGRVTIREGETAELTAKPVEGCFPFGKLTGSLKFQSSQLTVPAEGTVEVYSRLSRFWLFVLLILSIGLGSYTRTKLESERTVAAARAAADEELERLGKILGGVRDPQYQGRIQGAIDTLKGALAAKEAAAIATDTAEARDQVASFAKELAEKEKTTRAQIATLRAAVHDGKQQSGPLDDVAKRALATVSDVETTLQQGNVSVALERADQLAKDLPGDVLAALEPWRAAMKSLIAALATWKDVHYGDVTPTIAIIDQMKADDLPAIQSTFTQAATINLRLSAQLRETIIPDALDVASRVATGLEGVGAPPAAEIARLHAAITALSVDLATDDVTALLRKLSALRDAVAKALTAAVPAGKDVPPEIAQGEFLAALKAVEGLNPSDAPLDDEHAPLAAPPFSARALGPAGSVSKPRLVITISITGTPVVDQLVILQAEVTSEGKPVENVILRWEAGTSVHTGRAGELQFSFTPTSPTPVVVTVRAIGEQTGEGALTVTALPRELFDYALQRRLAARAAAVQTGIAGTLIVLAGMLIFKDWIGTFPDVLGAVFWGFAADISVGTVITYADPLKAKKPF